MSKDLPFSALLIFTMLVSSGCRPRKLIAGESVDVLSGPHFADNFDFNLTENAHKVSVCVR